MRFDQNAQYPNGICEVVSIKSVIYADLNPDQSDVHQSVRRYLKEQEDYIIPELFKGEVLIDI